MPASEAGSTGWMFPKSFPVEALSDCIVTSCLQAAGTVQFQPEGTTSRAA